MRLGLSSYTLPWAVGVPGDPPTVPLGAEGLIELAAVWGCGVVQLADNLPMASLTGRDVTALAAQARACGIALTLGIRGCRIARLRQALALAQELDAGLVRCLLDSEDDRPDHHEAVGRFQEVLPDFAAAGVVLAIENHDRRSCAELAALVEAVDHPALGICLDTANSLGAGEGLAEVVATLGPWTVDVHIKDVRIRRQPTSLGMIVEGAAAGEGQLDLAGLLGDLRRMGRDPDLIIELWTPRQGDLAATIACERDWAMRSVGNLRSRIAG